MRLYSWQSLKAIETLSRTGEHIPSWDRIMESSWENSYRWLTKQYNRIKGTNYSTPPVFWYTNYKQLEKWFRHIHKIKNLEIGSLLIADVPDEEILFHNFDLWHHVLTNFPIDWTLNSNSDRWENYIDTIMAQEKKYESLIEDTWKNCLVITKNTPKGDIHATTGRISLEWIKDYKS